MLKEKFDLDKLVFGDEYEQETFEKNGFNNEIDDIIKLVNNNKQEEVIEKLNTLRNWFNNRWGK